MLYFFKSNKKKICKKMMEKKIYKNMNSIKEKENEIINNYDVCFLFLFYFLIFVF